MWNLWILFKLQQSQDNDTLFTVTQCPLRGHPIAMPCGGHRKTGRTPIRMGTYNMLEISPSLYHWSSSVARRVLVGPGTLVLRLCWQSINFIFFDGDDYPTTAAREQIGDFTPKSPRWFRNRSSRCQSLRDPLLIQPLLELHRMARPTSRRRSVLVLETTVDWIDGRHEQQPCSAGFVHCLC